jgi:3-hydroxyisobutyrate dehydrogenase
MQGAVAVQMNMIAQLAKVATDHGVPLRALQAAFSTSTARNHMAQTRFPSPGVVSDSPASNGWRPDFSGRLMAKDVALVQGILGEQRCLDGLNSAAAALAVQIEDGHGDLDWSWAFA